MDKKYWSISLVALLGAVIASTASFGYQGGYMTTYTPGMTHIGFLPDPGHINYTITIQPPDNQAALAAYQREVETYNQAFAAYTQAINAYNQEYSWQSANSGFGGGGEIIPPPPPTAPVPPTAYTPPAVVQKGVTGVYTRHTVRGFPEDQITYTLKSASVFNVRPSEGTILSISQNGDVY